MSIRNKLPKLAAVGLITLTVLGATAAPSPQLEALLPAKDTQTSDLSIYPTAEIKTFRPAVTLKLREDTPTTEAGFNFLRGTDDSNTSTLAPTKVGTFSLDGKLYDVRSTMIQISPDGKPLMNLPNLLKFTLSEYDTQMFPAMIKVPS